ncbi:MAG: hypothetical protein LBB31_02735 [Prevotellaceae bacterium]|jgi:hypothetical protein|nr:hypothetical protein [Prevotellaceae bacterium]
MTKKLFCISVIFIWPLCHSSLYAQQLRWQWAVQAKGSADNHIGGTACDTAQNIYLAGNFSDSIRFDSFSLTSNGGEDIFLLKLNPEGKVLWAKSAGGINDDYPTAMAVSPAGMLYTVGLHGKNATFDNRQTGEKTYNLFISLHTAAGELKWIKSFAAKRSDYITSITIDSIGNLYFGGYFEKQLRLDEQHVIKANAASDAFVACLDSLGNVMWVRQWGGIGNDRISALHVHDSILWVAGHCSAPMKIETTTLSPRHDEQNAVFTVRCSLSGETTQVYSNLSGMAVTADCIIGLKDGKSIIAGNFSDSLFFDHTVFESHGNRDMFIAAFDSIGGLLWQKQIGSAAYDNLFDIVYHPWGYIIATGLYSAPLIFDQDTIGLSNNYCDVFAASYDEEGHLQEINIMDGKSEEFPQALAHDKEGHVYIAGLFRDTTTLRHSVLTSSGTEEIFLAKLYHCNKNKITFACDTVFFEGKELALETEGKYAAYDWEQGISTEATYIVTCSKIYQLRVEDSLHCVYRDSVTVRQIPVAPKVQIRAELMRSRIPDIPQATYYLASRKPEDESI